MTEELVDISVYQSVNFNALPSWLSGIVAKATEGNSFIDPKWWGHRQGMIDWSARTGKPIGAYCFSRPDLGNQPASEVVFFVRIVNPQPGWIMAGDFESAGGSQAFVRSWLDELAGALGGYKGWLYSYSAWMNQRGIDGGDNPLWYAWPDSNGSLNRGGVAAQQYAADTGVPGITRVDRNRFFGSVDQLKRLTIGGAQGGVFMALDDQEQVELLDKTRQIFTGLHDMIKGGFDYQTFVWARDEGKPQIEAIYNLLTTGRTTPATGGVPVSPGAPPIPNAPLVAQPVQLDQATLTTAISTALAAHPNEDPAKIADAVVAALIARLRPAA